MSSTSALPESELNHLAVFIPYKEITMNFHDDSDESSECLDLYDIIEIEQVLVL